eukprot:m.180044 g.180044  ORF g.180044 m.180044 type:complete len:298 (+) comp14914_c0_seq1:106-999(+)
MSDYYRASGGSARFEPPPDDEATLQMWADRRTRRANLYKERTPQVWADSPDEDAVSEVWDEFIGGTTKSKTKRIKSEDPSSSDTDSSSDSTDSEEERRRRRRAKKKKQSKKRKHKSKHRKRKRAKEESSSSSSSSSDSSDSAADAPPAEEQWVAKTSAPAASAPAVADEDVEIGPAPPMTQQAFNSANADFGGALLPGEGDAMANYVAEGKRIPRRGEIGLTSEEIDNFEKQGYVMSGSRHRRMEAVRIRKENQIYTADERRALAMHNYEEHQKKEAAILANFRELLNEKKKKAKAD